MKETLGGLMGRVDWVVATAWRRSQRDGAQINGASQGFDDDVGLVPWVLRYSVSRE